MGLPVEVRNSLITLPMTRRLKLYNGTNLIQHDEARVVAFGDYITHDRRANFLLTDINFGYTVSVGVGYPPQLVNNLLVDVGSSVTYLGTGTTYVQTHTSFNTKQAMRVQYGSGLFEGTLWTDTLTLPGPNALTIMRMPIGIASESPGMPSDGVLGIGPSALTRGSLTDSPERTILTVTDLLYDRHLITHPLVSLFFNPPLGIQTTMECSFCPITTAGASSYWCIDQSISYGSVEILSRTAGIVDCGCTFLYIPTNAYQTYKSITNSYLAANGLLKIPLEKYSNLENLKFHIGYETYSLTPNAQIWPRFLNNKVNGDRNAIYLIVKDMGIRPIAPRVNFINGYLFLQRFYTVFDTEYSIIGFAETAFTHATTN
ncbi:aspartic peptidase domain-containing protein [Suillus spraguei]|nr:aspartic peptidase domain-containing protein [Suillus spraguei]